MACAISGGYAIDCRDAVGGNTEVYIIDFNDVTAVAEASGLVTGITKASGKRFYKFEIPQSTAEGTDNVVASTQNGTMFFNHQFVFPLNKRDAATRNLVLVLAKARVLIVTKELSGRWTMYGREAGLWLTEGAGTSGVAGGDRNGYNLTFAGEQREPVLEVSSAVGLALETPG